MLYSPAFTFSSIYPLGVLPCAGLRLLVQRQFQTFLQALRRLRGAVLFRGLRSSSSWGFPFWLLGLTVQSSRPAFGGRLTFGVRPRKRDPFNVPRIKVIYTLLCHAHHSTSTFPD